jgi:hypothetical protein
MEPLTNSDRPKPHLAMPDKGAAAPKKGRKLPDWVVMVLTKARVYNVNKERCLQQKTQKHIPTYTHIQTYKHKQHTQTQHKYTQTRTQHTTQHTTPDTYTHALTPTQTHIHPRTKHTTHTTYIHMPTQTQTHTHNNAHNNTHTETHTDKDTDKHRVTTTNT